MTPKIFLVTALLFIGATSASAQDDPQDIWVTGGGLIAEDLSVDSDNVDIALKGHQFYLTGAHYGITSGRFDPHPYSCQCLPGQTYTLDAGWSGSDFEGYFKVGKTVYGFGGVYTGDYGYASVWFSGTWQAPLFDGRTERKVTAPFTFEGIAMTPFDAVSGLATTYFLQGTGRATLFFVWSSDEGRWLLENAKYKLSHHGLNE